MTERIQYPYSRLKLYDQAVFLTRYEGRERRASYPVSVDDPVPAFSRVPVSRGLLPANCLFWGRENGRNPHRHLYTPPALAVDETDASAAPGQLYFSLPVRNDVCPEKRKVIVGRKRRKEDEK